MIVRELCMILALTVPFTHADSGIPERLQSGKMRKYTACRTLFNLHNKTFAVESEDYGQFKRVCNCSFHRDPPSSRLAISCEMKREVVIPFSIADYEYFGDIVLFIVKYRKKGTTEWEEIELSGPNHREARIDLGVEQSSGLPYTYQVEIYAILRGGDKKLIHTDLVSAETGYNVAQRQPNRGTPIRHGEYTQYSRSFQITFDRITHSTIDLTFISDTSDAFKIEYINDYGTKLPVILNHQQKASIRGLQPDTEYVFIISFYRNGNWTEMRRKSVQTLAMRHSDSFGGTVVEPNYVDRDITLKCPYTNKEALQTVSWYRGNDENTARLLAVYNAETGTVTYPSDKDPKISVDDSGTLKITQATSEYADTYKCKFSIRGLGATWLSANTVKLYIVWTSAYSDDVDTYLIQYRPSGLESDWQIFTLENTGSAGALISNLQPLTEYLFEIYDFSDGERGNLLDSITKTTSDLDEEPIYDDPIYNGQEEPEIELDPCENFECGRGVCRSYPDVHCECEAGFTGNYCDKAVNFCSSNPCLRDSTCHNYPTGYVCACQTGYRGRNCDEKTDQCSPNHCRNGGLCSTSGNSYTCRCRRGFRGRRCETAVQLNYCERNPCVNGICTNMDRRYTCTCDRGYKGRNCDVIEDSPHITLRCPIQSNYGTPDFIQWYKLENGIPEEIFNYQVETGRGTNTSPHRYRGRLSSPIASKLRIDDIMQQDIGTYECRVNFGHMRTTSMPMRLVRVSSSSDNITVSWRPSRLLIAHYDARHRNVLEDEQFSLQELPNTAIQHSFLNLNPGGIYEILITAYTSGDDNDIEISFNIGPHPARPGISRGDRIPDVSEIPHITETITKAPQVGQEKGYDSIDVKVVGPDSAVPTGINAHLECKYPSFPGFKPSITWKKQTEGRSRFLYNKKMPPDADSRKRVNMITEHRLRIENFQPSDAGTYVCGVFFDIGTAFKTGSGSATLRTTEATWLSPPTLFQYQIVDGETTDISWQNPNDEGITHYIVRYWPTTRKFAEFEEREIVGRATTLTGLVEGNEYIVEIRAANDFQQSEPLEESFQQFVEIVEPPTNFLAAMLPGDQARIMWSEPEEETDITGYKVRYWDVSRPYEDSHQELTAPTNQAVLSSLIDGKTYQVWIQTLKGHRFSPELSSQFTKSTPTIPNPPENVQFKDIGSDTITVYWVAPSGWRSTDKYRVTVESQDDSFPLSKKYPDSAPQTLLVNNLRPGTTYLVTVSSVRDNFLSEPVHKYVRTIQNIILTAPYPNEITLECGALVFGDSYRVKWYKLTPTGGERLIFTSTLTTSRREFTANPRATEFAGRLSSDTLSLLTISNVQYPADFGTYKCVSRTRSGDGSDLLEVIARYPTRIEPPSNFSYVVTSDSTATVGWMHPYPDDVDGFEVNYWPTIRRFGSEYKLETHMMEAQLDHLVKGTEYQVVVKTKIGERVSDDSLVGQFIIFSDTVSDVRVVRVSDRELRLSWKNPLHIDGTLFSFRRGATGRWNDQLPMAPDVETKRLNMPLNEGETVYFKITTLKNNIPSPVVIKYTERSEGPVVEFDVEDPRPGVILPGTRSGSDKGPGDLLPPSDLVLSALNPTSLHARWTPTPNTVFDHYSVIATNLETHEYEEFNVKDSYISITGLTANARYKVVVMTTRDRKSSTPIIGTITLGRFEDIPENGESEPERVAERPPVVVSEEPPPDEPVLETEPAPVEQLHREISSSVPAPTDLRFSDVQRSRMTISWDSPSSEITDFGFKYRRQGTQDEWIEDDVSGSTSITLRDLRPNTIYSVEVSSYSGVRQESFPSVGAQRTRPSTPRMNLRRPIANVTEKTSSSLKVNWYLQNTDHLVIVANIGGAVNRRNFNVEKGKNSIRIDELEPAKRYFIKVYAVEDGRRSRAKNLYVTTKPESPKQLRVTFINSTAISLTWVDVSTLSSGYRVSYVNAVNNHLEVVETTSERITLTDLTPNTTYNIMVQTRYGGEVSSGTSLIARTMPETLKAPRYAEANIVKDDLALSWGEVPESDYYKVSYHPEGTEGETIEFDAPSSMFTIPDVLPGHYVVSVSAVKDDLQGVAKNFTVYMPVKSPTDLQIPDVSSTGLRAAWKPADTSLYNPEYNIIALPTSITNPRDIPVEERTPATSHKLSNLLPETEYTVEVISRYRDLKSEPVKQTITTEPLSQPQDLWTAVSQDSIRTVWARDNDVDYYLVTYYPVDDITSAVTRNVSSQTPFYDFSGVSPGSYEVVVTAYKGGRSSSPSDIKRVTVGLEPPTKLRFSDITEESVVAIWEPPRSRRRYEFEVKLVPTEEGEEPVTMTTMDNSYLFENLKPETQYYVEVTTLSGDQRSLPITEIVVTDQVGTPEDFESSVVDDTVSVTWYPVENVDYYQVIYNPVGEQQKKIVRNVTSTYLDINDLEPGEYEIKVIAVKSGQKSPPGVIVQTIDVPFTDNVVASILDEEDQPIEISWDPVLGADSYEVLVSTQGGSTELFVVNGDETNIILSDLLPSTEYVVKVNALVHDIRGQPTLINITTPLAAPSNPLISEAEVEDDNAVVSIEWDQEDDITGYEISYYTVTRNGDEVIYGDPFYQTIPSDRHGVTLEDLLPATEYIVEIRKIAGGEVSRPKQISLTTPLDKPKNIEFAPAGEDQVTVIWQKPFGEVTQYIITFVPNDGSDIIRIPVDKDRNSVTASGLKPDTEYEVRVIAQNSDKGEESSSPIEVISTKPRVTKPSEVLLQPEDDGSYTITWQPSEHPISYYRIIYTKTSGFPVQDEHIVANTEATSTIPQLIPNSEYDIILQAITDSAEAPTEVDSVTTQIRTGVPGMPPGISFLDVTDTTVIVQWTVPQRERYLTGYWVQIVQMGDREPTNTLQIPRTSNTATFTGLKPQTHYTVTVTPHIGENPGPATSEQVTTDELREIAAPVDVQVVEITSEDIVVQWNVGENYEYISEFNVVITSPDGTVIEDEYIAGDTYSYTVSDLQPGTPYDITIYSLLGDRSSESSQIRATTLPKEPEGVRSANVRSNQFEVVWLPADGDVTGYLVSVIPVDNRYANEHLYEMGARDTSILIPDVEPDTTYTIRVTAIGPESLESSAGEITVTTGSISEDQPDIAVQPEHMFQAVPGVSDVVVEWERQTDSPVSSYQILYRISGTDEVKIITVPSQAGETVLSSLQPNEAYDIWVRALLDTGVVLPVPITAHKTVPRIPSENHQRLTEYPVRVPVDGKIFVTWEDLGPDVTQYGVTYSNPSTDEQEQIVLPGDYTSTILSGLAPGDEYVISVIGMRDNSEPVLVYNVNVSKTDIPQDENSLTALSPNGQVTIEWVSDIEEDEDNRVIGYKIIFYPKCCLGEPEMAWVPGKDSNMATISMLEPDKEYIITVEATTSEGQNIPVSSMQILNKVEYPDTRISEWLNQPTNVAVEGEGYTATVHWEAPDDEDRPITHYTISYVPTDNRYAPNLRVTVPKTETSHTMTGLSQDTLYEIKVQSTNLPTKTSSDMSTTFYRTPIDSPAKKGEESFPGLEDDDEDEEDRPISIRTRPTTTLRPIRTRPTQPVVAPTRTLSTSSVRNPRTQPVFVLNRSTFTPAVGTTTQVPEPLRNTKSPKQSSKQPDQTITFATDDGQATLVWEPFTDEADVRYRVTYSKNDSPDDFTEVVLPSFSNHITLTTLEPDTPYNAFVDAITDNEEEFVRNVTIIEEDLPEDLNSHTWMLTPEIVSVDRQDENAIVHWAKPRPRGRQVTHYVLHFTPKFSDRDITMEIPAIGTSHVVNGLEPDESYTVTLQAVNQPTRTHSDVDTFESPSVPVVPDVDVRRTTTTRPTISVANQRTTAPELVRDTTTRQPEPILGREEELPESTSDGDTIVDQEEDQPGVEAVFTPDDNIILNWSPIERPVHSYTVQYRLTGDDTPSTNVSVPADQTWIDIPKLPRDRGYIITIYATEEGEQPQPIYNVNLNRKPGRDERFNLIYQPVTIQGENLRSVETRPVTEEVFIPSVGHQERLPDDQYSFEVQDGGENVMTTTVDEEYKQWLQPVEHPYRRRGNVVLQWNPQQLGINDQGRYRIQLIPVDSPGSQTITRYVLGNTQHRITGIEPGVSYRLYVQPIHNNGRRRVEELSADLVIPAFTSQGIPITDQQSTEVWVKEMRSGDLVLEWKPSHGVIQYEVEYQQPDGPLYRRVVDKNSRWIVLPRLAQGSSYIISIYALYDEGLTQIYTVNVQRRITGPSPPSKVQWFNMYGESVDLAWSPPHSEITGYTLTYKQDIPDSEEFSIKLPATTTRYHLDSLIPGATYIISIQSVRGNEVSRALRFPLHMIIPTVKRIYFQQRSPTVVYIRWPKISDYVSGYLVRVETLTPAGPDLVPEMWLPPDSTDFTVPNLEPGVKYQFTIRTLMGDKTSEAVSLHLWTLRAETQIPEADQSGVWTVSWDGNPEDVDYWRILVTRAGSQTPIFEDDSINRHQTSYELTDLTPGVQYMSYIYGVKNNISSSPLQILIPAYPTSHSEKISTRREHAYASGAQLMKKFLVRREADKIVIDLIPATTVDEYIVKYKLEGEQSYSTQGVEILYGNPTKAVITGLQPNVDYQINVIATKGNERSEMNINVRSQARNIQRRLPPLMNIRHNNDFMHVSNGFNITWDRPPTTVSYYTVAYTYSGQEEVTTSVTDPRIHVPRIPEDSSAVFKISYTTPDGRKSPTSVMKMSYTRSTSSNPGIARSQAHREARDSVYARV